MSVDISARVDISAVQRALGRMQAWGRDLRPVFRQARKPLMRDQREHKKNMEGPDGRWPARASATHARLGARGRVTGRKRRRGRLLGRLPTAVKLQLTRESLRVVSRVRWSGVHQDGAGRVGRAPRIPKRTYLWASRKLLHEVADIIATEAVKGWP